MSLRRDIPTEVSPEVVSALSTVAVLAIARQIYAKKIVSSKITNPDDLAAIVQKLGRTNDDAFEIHLDRFTKKFLIIRECIAQEEYESAVLLLFTTVEGEVNTALRILLRIRCFSHAAITDTIKGVDFRSKLDILLPLLGVTPPLRLRQFARQSQIIRNLVVHFRANPEIFSDTLNRDGDYKQNCAQAKEFFSKNPINRLERDLSRFVNHCVSSLPEVQDAIELLNRFRA